MSRCFRKTAEPSVVYSQETGLEGSEQWLWGHRRALGLKRAWLRPSFLYFLGSGPGCAQAPSPCPVPPVCSGHEGSQWCDGNCDASCERMAHLLLCGGFVVRRMACGVLGREWLTKVVLTQTWIGLGSFSTEMPALLCMAPGPAPPTAALQ